MTANILGGEFLTRSITAEESFIPEEFSKEHKAIAKTVKEFVAGEIQSRGDEIEHVNNYPVIVHQFTDFPVVNESFGKGIHCDLLSCLERKLDRFDELGRDIYLSRIIEDGCTMRLLPIHE